MISIVIPAYNAEPYLEETVNSVLEQTLEDWEIIIINDGSKDNTLELCEKLSKQDPRIHFFSQANQGVSVARNHGISKTKGEYIAFLDADDTWLKDNLEIKHNYLEANKDIDWVYSDMYHADNELNIIEEAPKGCGGNILDKILLWEGEVVPGPCSNLLIRKKCIDSGCVYDPEFSTAADQDFCIQLAAKHQGAYIDKVLWKYRYIASSMSRNVMVMEKDHIGVFKKAEKNKLYKNNAFKRECFSNLYMILAGSWWVNGGNKLRGIYFIGKSLLTYPSNIKKLLSKRI
tara:strand:+ start:1204 stop:2067 length:864 start_codon:yes stop_codon:yes gene_type:complete